MDAAVFLSLYLLFPSLYKNQVGMEIYLNKKLDAENLQTQRNVLIQKFNLNEEDFVGIENIYLGKQEYNIEELINPDVLNSQEEEEKVISLIKDDEGLLLYEFGEEKFSVEYLENNNFETVTVNNDVFYFSKYDKNCQLTEQLCWKNSSNLKDIILLSKTNYEYSSVIKKSVEDLQNNQFFVYVYNQNQKLVKSSVYKIVKEEKQKVQINKYKYDDEYRISELTEEYFTYRENPRVKNKLTETKFVRKYVYKYNKESEPNVYMYEDGILRQKTEYLSDKKYVETRYFNDGFVIKTVYENGILINEEISQEKKEN